MKDQLNAEEREILEKFERDELRPATGVDHEMAIAPQAADRSLVMRNWLFGWYGVR